MDLLFDAKLMSLPKQPHGPLKALVFILEKYNHVDLVRLLTLPRQIENPATRKHWGTEIASLDSFTQEPKSVEYGALPRCIGTDKQREIAKLDASIAETSIVSYGEV